MVVNVVVAVWSVIIVDALPNAKLHPNVNAPDKTDKTLIQMAEWSWRVIAKQISPTVTIIDIIYSSTGINGV